MTESKLLSTHTLLAGVWAFKASRLAGIYCVVSFNRMTSDTYVGYFRSLEAAQEYVSGIAFDE